MAAKPTLSDAEWATDSAFSSGPDSGQDTKVSASSGVKAQGWRPGDALGFVGAWFNFWMNQLYLWAAYLDDLHNSADFLDQNYAWGGTHDFASTTNHNGGANIADTFNLVFEGAGEVNYVTPRAFTIRRGMTGNNNNDAGVAWSEPGSAGGVELVQDPGSSAGFFYEQPLELPTDSVITGWRALVTALGGGGTLTVRLYRVEHTFGGSPALDSGTPVGAADTSTSGSLDTVEVTGLAESVNNAAAHYVLRFSDPSSPSVSRISMEIHAYEIDVEMPGLRSPV